MSLHEINFRVITNSDWREDFDIKTFGEPLDMTGAVLLMKMRRKRANAAEAPALSIGTAAGTMVLTNAPLGLFSILVPAAALTAIDPGAYAHDCVLTQGGVKRLLWLGAVNIIRGIT